MATTPTIDPTVLEATISVLSEHGWEGLTLERVAERADVSRPTLWRRGITREPLIQALLSRPADACRESMLGADTALREAGPERGMQPTPYISPLERLLRDGIADGSITWADEGGLKDFAVVLFNVLWTYVHLRTRHGRSSDRTRGALLRPLLAGLGSVGAT
jgi:AcrR family transcriptional regulator